uniref:Borealin n=1 Tax=Malurus cyaneus samueli TaxID=2593467 RepID=A0A8C5X9B2_9PASS
MAPGRKKGSSSRSRKLAAFLKDFDREVGAGQMRVDGECLVKEMENLYDMAILRLPVEIRQMNWLEYFGGLQTAVASQRILMMGEGHEGLNGVCSGLFCHEKGLRQIFYVEASVCVDSAVKASTKKPPVARRPPSARVKRLSKRSSKNSFVTPASGRMVDACVRGGTSMLTPRFDSRVFKTPGLRTPALNERVYTISANGSPLADTGDAVLTLPLGGGESIRLTAKDLTKKNFLQLNPKARGLMKKLSVVVGCTSVSVY